MDYHSVIFNNITAISLIKPQDTAILSVLVVGFLIISFVIGGAETAFMSLSHKDITLLKSKQQVSYQRIVTLMENPPLFLGTILIANTFLNIALIIISDILLDGLLESMPLLGWAKFIFKLIIIAVGLLLIGEVIPKTLAANNPIRYAKETGPFMELIYKIFRSMSQRMVHYTGIIQKKLNGQNTKGRNNEELFHAIDITDTGSSENEKNILKGILKFGDITVKQIMRTRLEVSGIDYNKTDFESLITEVQQLHYSRIPVFREDLDDVIGMIHTKDLLPHINQSVDFDWHKLIRPPYFVHEQKHIEDLLKEFQSKHIHFAIVVDEFGGTSGIVTMEDILEEIIGDINDEFDEEDKGYKKIDNYTYAFEGKTMINDVCKIMELPQETFDSVRGESDSIAGLVLELAGDIPRTGQIIRCGDFEITVMEAEKTRINKVRISIKLPENS